MYSSLLGTFPVLITKVPPTMSPFSPKQIGRVVVILDVLEVRGVLGVCTEHPRWPGVGNAIAGTQHGS